MKPSDNYVSLSIDLYYFMKRREKLVYDRDTGTTEAISVHPGIMYANFPEEKLNSELEWIANRKV